MVAQEAHKGAESLHDEECSGRPLEADGNPLTAIAEDEECRGRPLEADGDPLTAVAEDGPLVTIQEDAKELNVDHSVAIRHVKQIGKVKKLSKWVPH